MGYSLPAAIGAHYASGNPVYCFVGDGGLQMNIQEMEYIVREDLPVHIFVLNNRSLGMIRQFQEANFDGRFYDTIEGKGYSAPNFAAIGTAYGLLSGSYASAEAVPDVMFSHTGPTLADIDVGFFSKVAPKLSFGDVCQDQAPKIPRDLYERLMGL